MFVFPCSSPSTYKRYSTKPFLENKSDFKKAICWCCVAWWRVGWEVNGGILRDCTELPQGPIHPAAHQHRPSLWTYTQNNKSTMHHNIHGLPKSWQTYQDHPHPFFWCSKKKKSSTFSKCVVYFFYCMSLSHLW